ncbi:hypothetical protein ACFL4H_00055 [Candidatus Neomarinimicrobiota bacterium]
MKVILTVKERIGVANLLPEQGDITNLRQIRALREDLAFTDEENDKWKIERENMMIRWDENLIEEVEKEFSDRMFKVVSRKLKELNKTHKLTEDMISLYEKFVEVLKK